MTGAPVDRATAERPGAPLRRRTRRSGRPPAPLTPLIGREAELSGLIAAVDQGRRLITLVGPGGVGKTTAVAGTRRPRPQQAAHRVRRAGRGDGGRCQRTGGDVALSLGLEVSRRGAAPSLVAALADGAWLLLVDEAEVVADALGPLPMLVLEGNPDAQIVVSSRRPLDVPGELTGRSSRWTTRPPTAATRGRRRPCGGWCSGWPTVRCRWTTTSGPPECWSTWPAGLTACRWRSNWSPDKPPAQPGRARRAGPGAPRRSREGSRRPRQRSLRRTFATVSTGLDPAAHGVPALGRLRRQLRPIVRAGGADAGGRGEGGCRRGGAGAGPGRAGAGRSAGPGTAELPSAQRAARARPGRGCPGRRTGPAPLRHRRWFADRWSRERGREELYQDVRDHQEDYLQALSSRARRRRRPGGHGSGTHAGRILAAVRSAGGQRQVARPDFEQSSAPAAERACSATGATSGAAAEPRRGAGPRQIPQPPSPFSTRPRTPNRWCWPTRCAPWNSGIGGDETAAIRDADRGVQIACPLGSAAPCAGAEHPGAGARGHRRPADRARGRPPGDGSAAGN